MKSQLPTSAGIYEIRNITNGHFYIGSALNFRKRYNNHLCCLRNNKHDNSHLQRAWSKYGENAFTFEVIQNVEDTKQLLYIEQQYLDTLINVEGCYNMCPSASAAMTGRHHTEETKAKMRAKALNRTPEHQAKLNEAANNRSPEWHAKQSIAQRNPSAERREKARVTQTGRKASPEARANMSAAAKKYQDRRLSERAANME